MFRNFTKMHLFFITIYRNVIVKTFYYTFLQLTIKTVYSFRFQERFEKMFYMFVDFKSHYSKIKRSKHGYF